MIDLRTLRPLDMETVLASVQEDEPHRDGGRGLARPLARRGDSRARDRRGLRLSRCAAHRFPARTCPCLTPPTSKNSRCPMPPRWCKPSRRFATGKVGDARSVYRGNCAAHSQPGALAAYEGCPRRSARSPEFEPVVAIALVKIRTPHDRYFLQQGLFPVLADILMPGLLTERRMKACAVIRRGFHDRDFECLGQTLKAGAKPRGQCDYALYTGLDMAGLFTTGNSSGRPLSHRSRLPRQAQNCCSHKDDTMPTPILMPALRRPWNRASLRNG